MDVRRSPSRVKVFTAALLAVGLLLSTASARADEPGQDEVTLKNGGTVRGTVVSSEPGTSVKIIELGQTEVRVIPWSQVSDVEKGKYAPRAAAQPGPAGPGYGAAPLPVPQALPPPQAKMGDLGVVRLHIDSPLPATVLEQRSALVGAYNGYGIVLTQQRAVCASPCDTVVDGTGGRSFMLANDVYPSPGAFSFAGMRGDVTMRLEPGSKGRRAAGVTAVVLGASAVVAGAVLLPVALGTTTHDLNTGVTVSVPDKGLRSAGIGLLAGGLVAIGGGIALVVTGVTRMTLEPRSAAAPATAARVQPRYWLGEF